MPTAHRAQRWRSTAPLARRPPGGARGDLQLRLRAPALRSAPYGSTCTQRPRGHPEGVTKALGSFPAAPELLRRFAHPDAQRLLDAACQRLLNDDLWGRSFRAAREHAAARIGPARMGCARGPLQLEHEIWFPFALHSSPTLDERGRHVTAAALGSALMADLLAAYPGEEETCRTLLAPLDLADELLAILDTPEHLHVFAALLDMDFTADLRALAHTTCDLLAILDTPERLRVFTHLLTEAGPPAPADLHVHARALARTACDLIAELPA